MYTILSERALVRISGEDRLKFLQGLISNDVNKLKADNSLYACMLTPQGKYFADFFLKLDQDCILMDLPAARKDEILKKLKLYKLRSAVIFTECPEYKILSFLNISINKGLVFADPRSNKLGLRGFIHESEFEEVTHGLELSQNAYDLARIDNFVAEGEKDLIPEQSFPLEYGLEELNAFDYKKGCYVGQELIARTHYLGVIRKQIVQVTSAQVLPVLGTLIYAGEQKLGLICSSIANKGLALIRTENVTSLSPEAKITAGSQEIKLKFKENI